MLNEQLGLLRSSFVMTAHAVAGPPDATIATRAKSGLGIGDADSKAARLSLPLRPGRALAQDQESGSASGQARSRRGLGPLTLVALRPYSSKSAHR